MNVEFRATALNVFNMTNFGNGGTYANIGSTFGQVTGRVPRYLRHGGTRRTHPGIHAAVQLLTSAHS